MAAGLFELRKDPITGWWVATVVDREFHRDRFARAAEPVDDRVFGCANCTTPPGDGVRTRMLRGLRVPRRRHRGRCASRSSRGSARSRSRRRAPTGSWRTVVAPPGEHRPLHAVGNRVIEALLRAPATRSRTRATTAQTEYLTVVQNWGAQAGRPDQPPVPRPLRPAPDPAPHRRGARRRGAVRHPRGGVPVLPARPRRGPSSGAARLGGRRQRGVRPVRLPLRRSRSGSSRAGTRRTSAACGTRGHRGHRRRRSARSCPGWPRASTARPTTSSSTRRRCASRSTPPTTGTGRSTLACARSPVSSWEPDCPVNPVSPEDAVEELLGRADAAGRRDGLRRQPAGPPTGVTPAGSPPSLAQ